MIIEQLPVGPLLANCYVVAEDASRRAIVVDPGADGPRILALIKRLRVHVDLIVLTHGHFDHVGAVGALRAATGAPVAVGEAEVETVRVAKQRAELFAGLDIDEVPLPDRLLHDGEILHVGDQALTVANTPGHSPGHITVVGDGFALVGDVVFAGGIGRTDLPGGNFEVLMTSITSRILTLPDETILYPGHGPATTVGRERSTNPFLVHLAQR